MRLATFNILHGRSLEDDRYDVDRFARAIASLDADILALQEVDRDQPRSLGSDLTGVAARAMGAVESRFVAALSGTPGAAWQASTGHEAPGTPAYGIALLSRFPVRSWQVLRLPPSPVSVRLRQRGRLRPRLVRSEPRMAVLAAIETPLGVLNVAATHLAFLPGSNVIQLRHLTKALAAGETPAVLMGDLNLRPLLAGRLTRMHPLATGATYPADRPTRQIDHILARNLSTTGSSAVIHVPVSDHRALVVDLPERG